MIRNIVFVTLMITLLTSAVFGSEVIIERLYEPGWKLVHAYDDGREVFVKEIEGFDLHAVKVLQVVDVDPRAIIDVVEDIAEYQSVLTSAKGVEFLPLDTDGDSLHGYQYMKVPLMRNRHLVYSMKRAEYDETRTSQQVDWVLLSRNSDFAAFVDQRENEHGEPVYLDEGAGSYRIERTEDGRALVSYRLYMDPGGWIPDFIIDRVNRRGIADLFADVIREAKRRLNGLEG